MSYSLQGKRVFVAGHRGMVGSALVRRLAREDCDIVTVERATVDLRRQADVENWIAHARPEALFVAAATVGGIVANSTRPAEFIYDNLAIATNLIEAARRTGAQKLLFLASSSVYPRAAPQPMSEDTLLTGALEPSHEWYSTAKIAGIKLCQAYRRQYGCDFISLAPSNLYGPNDGYDLTGGHVVPSLLAKTHRAKIEGVPFVDVWGTGTPRRELLHVDDLADAATFAMKHYSEEAPLNVGAGVDLTIRELAELICDVVGFRGELRFDPSKPDGPPRKLLDVRRLAQLGWHARIPLREGLAGAYQDYLSAQT
jgi:GDP-L-fucose synthase